MSADHSFDTLLDPASNSSRRVFLALPAIGVAAAFYRPGRVGIRVEYQLAHAPSVGDRR